ncbi:hypothetical protein YYC_04092 [Plasmodium yoelii 17X]|nr:conserved Plasmodium protein, unknown function [Plasmodium yoelii]ETB58502.1 hypothetical protein YYC_04092 [Plasmodium yoelii 17X]CDU17107.1 conserved Plasmodium protein, unknown function [Plasmodium yoelii]VTZ75588.1 conserved Plasmodium protein, unknown function [Plasmodium yoelii]|eukprot:XP_022813218.1 conserved Plasmodium protein, unknown function [Plasmodium yoelii]
MISIKYFILCAIWIILCIEMQKEGILSIQKRNDYQSKSRILRMDTPDPLGDSENYEVVTNGPTGNVVTVYNKHGEPLYFYINKKKTKKDSKLRKKEKK